MATLLAWVFFLTGGNLIREDEIDGSGGMSRFCLVCR
jgi:hypothetical protein